MPKVSGTTEDLRKHLFDELDALKLGKISIHRATATYKIAAQILNAARLDLEHYKLVKMLEAKETPVVAVALTGY